MKKLSIACGLFIASGSLFAQQYSIKTVAGTGTPGWSGDLGPALSAQFQLPTRVLVDSSGNVYLNDYGNSSIREIYTNGTVNSITGNGSPGFPGDGKSSVGAQLASPHDIALDAAGNLYIADTGNSRIRIVSNGTISTFAGGARTVEGPIWEMAVPRPARSLLRQPVSPWIRAATFTSQTSETRPLEKSLLTAPLLPLPEPDSFRSAGLTAKVAPLPRHSSDSRIL